MSDASTTRVLQACLDRLRAGDGSARDELINHASKRLVTLTRKMLGSHDGLRSWEQTDDVAQNAVIRLCRALEQIQPATVREFMGLASLQIRRELMDLARRHYGRKPTSGDDKLPSDRAGRRPPVQLPFGRGGESGDQLPGAAEPSDETYDPVRMAIWSEFHQRVDTLPEQEREVVELRWYQELSVQEVADLLDIDRSTVRDRFRAARLKLGKVLPGGLEGERPA